MLLRTTSLESQPNDNNNINKKLFEYSKKWDWPTSVQPALLFYFLKNSVEKDYFLCENDVQLLLYLLEKKNEILVNYSFFGALILSKKMITNTIAIITSMTRVLLSITSRSLQNNILLFTFLQILRRFI